MTVREENYLEEEGYFVSNFGEISDMSITLTIRGERNSLDTLTKLRDSISAYVNLSKSTVDVSAGTANCQVETSLPIYSRDSLEIVSQNIRNVVFNIEEYSSKEMPVEVVFSADSVNYFGGNAKTEPAFITVSGPKSAVNSVYRVCVYFDETAPEDNKNKTVYAYDSAGNEVKNIAFDRLEADIILPERENVIVEFVPHYKGEPAEGYGVVSVEVTGIDSEFFSYGGNLKQVLINLPEIDITGVNKTVSQTFNIYDYLPESVEISGDGGHLAEVSVNIEKVEETDYEIDTSRINVEGLEEGYAIEFAEEKMKFTLAGKSEELEKINEDSIILTLFLDECIEGEFVSSLKAEVPENIMVKEEIEVGYKIIAEE